MPNSVPLPRVSDITQFRSFYDSGHAVVVEGAAKSMPAFERWTDAFLCESLVGMRPTVRLPDGRLARMPFKDFWSYLRNPDDFECSYGSLYLTDFYVLPTFGETQRETLSSDVQCPLPRQEPVAEWVSLYAGPGHTSSPMHQDVFSTHTWLAELRGEKAWRLCKPGAIENTGSDRVDVFAGKTEGISGDIFETTLRPGDVIYLPPNWWHQTLNLGESTLALSGNFCSPAAARSALREAEASDDPTFREVWVRTWTAVLANLTSDTRAP